MENPSQSHYTIEELFMLKPEIIEKIVDNSNMPVIPASDVSITFQPQHPLKNAFWSKYKWYSIGGVILIIAGVALYIYNENQKKKKNLQRN